MNWNLIWIIWKLTYTTSLWKWHYLLGVFAQKVTQSHIYYKEKDDRLQCKCWAVSGYLERISSNQRRFLQYLYPQEIPETMNVNILYCYFICKLLKIWSLNKLSLKFLWMKTKNKSCFLSLCRKGVQIINQHSIGKILRKTSCSHFLLSSAFVHFGDEGQYQ